VKGKREERWRGRDGAELNTTAKTPISGVISAIRFAAQTANTLIQGLGGS
jgi:hypothetical protein